MHQITPSAHPSVDTSSPSLIRRLPPSSLPGHHGLAGLHLSRCACVLSGTSSDLRLQVTWHRGSGMYGSGGSTRSMVVINEHVRRQRMSTGAQTRTGRRHREMAFSLSLPRSISSFLSDCISAYCRLQQFHNPRLAGRPAGRAGRAAPFHAHTDSSRATTGKGLLCFHLQVLSPTSLGLDLVIAINNCSSGRDKPSAFHNSWFCL